MVVYLLPKQETRVRFSYPAQVICESRFSIFGNIFIVDSVYTLINSSADIAQLVEQCFRKAEVAGSIPAVGSKVSSLTRGEAFELTAGKRTGFEQQNKNIKTEKTDTSKFRRIARFH